MQESDSSRAAGSPRGSRPGAGSIALAALLDVAVVVLFAASGRSEHGRAVTFAGVWETAWPFLLALALVWGFALIWRRPFALLRSGLPVWLGTLGLGMVMRTAFTDGGAALPFVLVTSGALGIGLLGWRLIAALVLRLRRSRDPRPFSG